MVECRKCKGKGTIPCEDCGGIGTFHLPARSLGEWQTYPLPQACKRCEGDGKIDCPECSGSGTT